MFKQAFDYLNAQFSLSRLYVDDLKRPQALLLMGGKISKLTHCINDSQEYGRQFLVWDRLISYSIYLLSNCVLTIALLPQHGL